MLICNCHINWQSGAQKEFITKNTYACILSRCQQHCATEIRGAGLIYGVKTPAIHLENKPYGMFSDLSCAEEEQIFLCIFLFTYKCDFIFISPMLETSYYFFAVEPSTKIQIFKLDNITVLHNTSLPSWFWGPYRSRQP